MTTPDPNYLTPPSDLPMRALLLVLAMVVGPLLFAWVFYRLWRVKPVAVASKEGAD